MLIGKYENFFETIPNEIGGIIFWGIIFGFNIYCLIRAIMNTVQTIKGKFNLKDMAKLNMVTKLIHIPAYLFNFILGVVGALLGLWGIGFFVIAVFANYLLLFQQALTQSDLTCAFQKKSYRCRTCGALLHFKLRLLR